MKKKITGKEARYILRQHRINQADLAAKLGISPQSLNSRLNVDEFTYSRQLEINNVLGQHIFDIEAPLTDRQPILDIRVSAGTGIGLEGDENTVTEYVSVREFMYATRHNSIRPLGLLQSLALQGDSRLRINIGVTSHIGFLIWTQLSGMFMFLNLRLIISLISSSILRCLAAETTSFSALCKSSSEICLMRWLASS